MNGKVLTDTHYDWVAAALGVDPRKSATASRGTSAGQPSISGNASAPGGQKTKAQLKSAPAPDDGTLVFNGTVRKVPSDPDDPFSPEIEVGEIEMPTMSEPMPKVRPHNDVIVLYLQNLPEFASSHAVSYCQAVAEACEGFEKYAKKRIKELTKPSFGAEQLFGALIGVVATVATGGLGGEALEGLAKLVADGVKDAIKDAVKEQGNKYVKKAGGDESKAEELESVAEQIAGNARRDANRIKDTVVSNVSAQTDPLIQKLQGGQKLTKDEDAFVLPFAAADSAGKDRLYRRLGVPDLTAAKSVKLNLFGKLTWQFEDQIWDDKSKDDIAAQKNWRDHADSEADKAKAQRNMDELEEQAKHNAKATAHNAWGKFKEETT